MPRYTRKTAILAKIETTYGTDAAPTGAANALLISNQSVQINYNNVNRDIIRPYFGGAEQLAGTRNIEISFDVELAGSGAAGTAPAYGPLLRGCAMAETVTASTRVEYNPITDSTESLTLYYYDDGVVHKALGCVGTFELKAGMGERPVISYKFTGIDGGTVAQANPSVTLTGFKAPLAVIDANAGDITLGCTYSAGALSGGTTYTSRGLNLSLGNDVKHIPLLGGESVSVVGRETTGSCELDLSAAQEASFITDINGNTLTSLGFTLGTAAGYKAMIYAPSVQRVSPKKSEIDGRRLIGMDLRLLPSSGNDELRLVLL